MHGGEDGTASGGNPETPLCERRDGFSRQETAQHFEQLEHSTGPRDVVSGLTPVLDHQVVKKAQAKSPALAWKQ